LKALSQTKQDLLAALKPTVDELIKLDPPFEKEMLQGLVTTPQSFFSPKVVRANRGFIKGQVPKERVVREFGDSALTFFNDMTTDAKLNPRPKPEEISLAFKNDFESLLQQNPSVLGEKRLQLEALYQRVQRSKTGEAARAQRNAFNRLSFLLELLHYYENQSTESPEVTFAQRLPALVEQLVLVGGAETLDEKLISQTETLLGYIVGPDHRLMVINNVGKSGGLAKTLKYVLRLRSEKIPDPKVAELNPTVVEFVAHLVTSTPPKSSKEIAAYLRLVPADWQKGVCKAVMSFERLRKEDAEKLGKAIGQELGITGLEEALKAQPSLSTEMERQLAWGKIETLIERRTDPTTIANAVRERLHAKYDADEIKQSWVTLTGADPISLIRVFCQLPYLADGRTDPVARAAMETYVSRLTHEKYAVVYNKVLTSLRNMFKANPESPTLVNFIALVKWIDAAASIKISGDIGMAVAA
jgi:hypothetical protein